eukprot:9469595-Pyramimonas_sp.AAC.1
MAPIALPSAKQRPAASVASDVLDHLAPPEVHAAAAGPVRTASPARGGHHRAVGATRQSTVKS